MRCFVVALAAASLLASAEARGQVQKFPYAATVGGDDVYVRSGPGKKYYPTGKLSTGAQVVVHRHDPGGWYMIAPPEGSFSWIAAESVKPAGNRRALVAANNVPVLVGSAIGDVRDVEQVRLSVNDEVQLLDDVSVAGANGANMYRIVPPRGEYRWILGQFVVPMDETVRRLHDRDPFATPSQAKPATGGVAASEVARPRATAPIAEPPLPDVDGQGLAFEDRPAAPAAAPASPPAAPVPSQVAQQQWEKLRALDARMQEMALADIGQWNVAELERGYRELEKEAAVPAIVRALPGRLATVAGHAELKAEYDDFVRLTEATSRRDAELASMQGARGSTMVGFRPQPTPVATLQPIPQIPAYSPAAPPSSTPIVSSRPGPTVPSTGPVLSAPATLEAPRATATPPNYVTLQPPATSGPSAPTSWVLGPNGVPIAVSAVPQPQVPAPPVASVAEPPTMTIPPHTPGAPPFAANPVILQGPFAAGEPTVGTPAGSIATYPGLAPNPAATLPSGVPPTAYPGTPPANASSDPTAETEGFLPPVVRSGEPIPGSVPGFPLPRGTVPLPRGMQPFGGAQPQFAGAGIIQKTRPTAPGMPQYVLVAPQGRVLAFLQPEPGVNLDPHVGQQMGVSGQRSHRPDLRGDLISVQDVTPVRLAPQ